MRPRPRPQAHARPSTAAAQMAETVTVAGCENPVANDTAQPVPSAVGPSEDREAEEAGVPAPCRSPALTAGDRSP